MKEIILIGTDKTALIDDSDIDLISPYNWRVSSPNKIKEYAFSTINGKTVMMHRLILNAVPSELIDHIDHNGLNNQRSNLRKATIAQNRMNSVPTRTECSSKYKGVHHSKRLNRWQATIKFEQKTIGLGWFDTELEAALAYNLKAKSLFGEFACLNDIPPGIKLGKVGKHLVSLVSADLITENTKFFTHHKSNQK